MATRVDIGRQRTLAEHARYPELAAAVRALQQHAAQLAHAFDERTVWMVNSTAQGGGVSEMLPGMVAHLNELGIRTEWAVIDAADPDFFRLTKRVHNLIHGDGDTDLTAADRATFERTNRANTDVLRSWMRNGDILVVHDPQPMPLALMLRDSLDLTCIWRCHIGLDERTDATRAAWRFLRPYAASYEHAVFSAPEYVVSYFDGRSSIIYPSLDPLSEKNEPLDDVAGVLARAGLRTAHPAAEPFRGPVRRLQSDGSFGSGTAPDEIGFFARPIVTQVSRWDRLKGFLPLMHGFAALKQRLAAETDPDVRRRLHDVRLVLAGPDPDSIADDPEGRVVLDELRAAWLELGELRSDIALLALPMDDLALNALIVNALQRASTIVAQNSLREGFGLTITEAMWKGLPVLSNARACGPRQQVRGGTDGVMISDPEDPGEIAAAIRFMLREPEQLARWGASARQRAHDHFLIYTQLRRWLRLFATLTHRKSTPDGP